MQSGVLGAPATKGKDMDIKLVVVRDFGAHRRGDVIEDEALISQILADERAACVVRVAAQTSQEG